MSVSRQANILGQQRIDVPHLRAIESSICNDFDLLAGKIMAGQAGLVVSGFKVISTGATTADQLQLDVANGTAVHFLASESGSIFSVPADRAVERLNSTNPRMFGSFSPNAVNYVGIDFTRVVDTTTADLTMFLDATQEQEVPMTVPLARVIDYRIIISTRDFNSQPGVCPIAKVVTNTGNEIISIEDARNLFFRLGSGGTTPDRQNFFSWPSGRKEFTTGDIFNGGDKSITSMKGWMDASMTRIWELGGGEYWYSASTDRNVRFLHTGSPFVTTGEYFEWSGTHAHWQGLRVAFDNSTASYNEIKDQTTNSVGLTDLADGECLYVDLDRSTNRAGLTALVAQKAPLTTLGTGSPPGSRLVFMWRFGSQVFTRDQGYAIGSSFITATTGANGTVRLSASAHPTPSTPVVAVLQASGLRQAIAGGLSRGNATVNDFIGGAGSLTIGGGTQDYEVDIGTNRPQDSVNVTGLQAYALGNAATLSVINGPAVLAAKNLILRGSAFNDVTVAVETAITVESIGSMGFRNVAMTPATPTPGAGVDGAIRSKVFFQTNGLSTPDTRDVFCVMWFDGSITQIAEGPLY